MQRPNKRGSTSLDVSSRPGSAAVIGLLVGAVYLWWRSSTLGSGMALALSIPLLAIEIWAFVELVLLTVQTWRLPGPSHRGSISAADPVDIAVVAAGLSADELERSLIACRAVRGRGSLIVIDDERRLRHRALAADHGASYRIDRRTIEAPGLAAHRNTTSARYLWLTAGQLPMPDLVEVAGPRFDRPEVAVCQLATSLLNRDDLAHLGRARDDDALVNEVIGPALSRWDAGPWLGSASIVRREAIDAIGGLDLEVPIERLTARLHRAGWATTFERRRLVATTVPEAIDRYLTRRRHQAASALSVVLSSDGPLVPGGSMTPTQRLAHLGAVVRFGTGPRLLASAMVLVAVLATGRFPADVAAPALAAAWATSALAAAAARRSLARGTRGWGDGLRQGWRTLGSEVGAMADVVRGRIGPAPLDREPTTAPTGLRALAHLPLLDAIVLAIDLALVVRAATLVDADLLPPFSTGQRVVVFGFALILLVPIVDVLQVVVLRQQRRSNYRIPAVLEATLDGTRATTVDITPEGAGILLPFEAELGSTGHLEISLPGPDGLIRRVVGRATVRSVRPEESDRWRVGLELLHLAPAARQALVSFCAQLPVDDDPDEAEELVTDPATAAADRRRRSIRRATVTAGAAGLATLVFGPAVASASTASPELVERVCVDDAAGRPLAGVVVEQDRGGTPTPVGTTDLGGCVLVEPDPSTIGFALDLQQSRYLLQPSDYLGTEARVARVAWLVRVVDVDAEPVGEVEVRFFGDRWRPASPPDEPGDGHRFESWPPAGDDQAIEVVAGGARHVSRWDGVGPRATEPVIVLARVRLTPSSDPLWIDRGRGWEPVVDGMDLVPGPVAVRLDDGTILRLDVPESNELTLPVGRLTPVEVDVPTVGPNGSETPASTSSTTSTPGSTSSTLGSTTSTSISTSVGPSSSTVAPDPAPTPSTQAEPASTAPTTLAAETPSTSISSTSTSSTTTRHRQLLQRPPDDHHVLAT